MRRLSRYQEPTQLQSTYDLKPSLDLKNKQLMTSSSVANHTTKNPEVQFLRLPALNSMRRSSSSFTERNTKFKLQNIEQKLQELSADVHNTRLEAGQTLNHIRYLKQSLAVNELGSIREDTKKQARGLERFMKGIVAANEDRTKCIKEDCADLWKSTEQIHQVLFELKMRTEQLERNMGFNHKFRCS